MLRFTFCVCLFLITFISWAQDEKSTSLKGVPFKERIVTGGGFGLGFSNIQDFVMVSPTVGYMVTTKLMTGVNITYRYTKYKFVRPSVSLNDYGVSPFVRYMVFRNIFAQAEYEHLNYQFLMGGGEKGRRGYNSFLAGGGFIQPVGSKAAIYFMALYNFSYRTPAAGEYSPYASPWVIRAGINIGGLGF